MLVVRRRRTPGCNRYALGIGKEGLLGGLDFLEREDFGVGSVLGEGEALGGFDEGGELVGGELDGGDGVAGGVVAGVDVDGEEVAEGGGGGFVGGEEGPAPVVAFGGFVGVEEGFFVRNVSVVVEVDLGVGGGVRSLVGSLVS